MIKAYLIWSCLAFGCSSYNNFCETKFYKEIISHPPKYIEKIHLNKEFIRVTFTHYDRYISERHNQKYLNKQQVNLLYLFRFRQMAIQKITVSDPLDET